MITTRVDSPGDKYPPEYRYIGVRDQGYESLGCYELIRIRTASHKTPHLEFSAIMWMTTTARARICMPGMWIIFIWINIKTGWCDSLLQYFEQ